MVLKASRKLVLAIQEYQKGDDAAFDTIYHESIQYVTRCVLNVLNRTAPGASEDLKQDIIQDTYFTISAKLDTLQNPEAFLQWAGQIATRHALRTWKKDIVLHETEVSDDEVPLNLADDKYIPEDILLNEEKRQMLRSVLKELSDNQYFCIVEYFYNGLTEREIAEKLGMPLNTVKTNLSRGKKKLETLIGETEKRSGVRLYSLGGVLLILLWQDALAVSASAAEEAAILGAIHAQASGTAASAASTAGASAKAGVTIKSGVAAKAAAAALAGTVAIGSIAGGVVLTHKNHQIPDDAFRFNGHSYYILEEQCDTWEEAQRYCESVGGHLAVITSQEENEALYGYTAECQIESAYFGLYLDEETGEWKWVNGEELNYLNWNKGEPNNQEGIEKYGMFYFKYTSGTWNDGGFGMGTERDTTAFLCEWDE